MYPTSVKHASLSSLSTQPSYSLAASIVQLSPWTSMRRWMFLMMIVVWLSIVSGNKHSWEAPGCHLVGHTRTVTIAGCVPFEVTTNACRGFCVSYAVPSSSEALAPGQNFLITSKADCCGIVDTHEVKVWVACRDGYQQKTFKSALSCACSICRRPQ